MVTKHALTIESTGSSFVLAKKLMVTKQELTIQPLTIGFVLAKKLMVTKHNNSVCMLCK